jgi:hypothetical protein
VGSHGRQKAGFYFCSRFKVQGSRFKVQGSRFKVQSSKFKPACRRQGSGFSACSPITIGAMADEKRFYSFI